ncbi:S24 family peptidase [Devosia sp. A369]
MTTAYERIRARIDELHPGTSDRAASLAASGGRNADLLRTIKQGRSAFPRGENLQGLADYLRWPVDALTGDAADAPREFERVPIEDEWRETSDADGAGYHRDNYEPAIPGAIPELDAKAGAGEGAVGEVMVIPIGNGTISAHKILDEWRIPPAYLREAVSNPDNAIVLGVQGDSMLPNYTPGDKVIIDLGEHELRADGVYLISDGFSEPQIKRLQRILFTVPPRCKIISDNPSYDAQEVDIDGLRIMGKVAAHVGRR